MNYKFVNQNKGIEVPCKCGGLFCGDSVIGPLLYRCNKCKRLVPWCFGAADNMPDSCDDCWKPEQ